MLRIKLIRSVVGHNPRNRRTVAALGLRKTNQVVEHDDNPTIRGMVHHVKELLNVEVVDGTPQRNSLVKKAADKSAPKAAPATKVAKVKPEPETAAKPAAKSATPKAETTKKPAAKKAPAKKETK
jgi:large subunit ribosomal protein L30